MSLRGQFAFRVGQEPVDIRPVEDIFPAGRGFVVVE